MVPDNSDCEAGTGTVTAVRAEQIDTDPARLGYGLLPDCTLTTGTLTKTSIQGEASDADRALSPLTMIPVNSPNLLGTQTQTRVLAETNDQDPQRQAFQTIP